MCKYRIYLLTIKNITNNMLYLFNFLFLQKLDLKNVSINFKTLKLILSFLVV